MADEKAIFGKGNVPALMGISRTTGELRLIKVNEDGTPYINISDTGGTPYQFSGTANPTLNTVTLGATPANSFAIKNTHSANTLYLNITDATPSAGTVYYPIAAGESVSVDADILRYSVKADTGKTASYVGFYIKN